jgi:flagellar assembly protein FliH
MKGIPIGSQAEQLIKARREVSRVEELTRVEQIELEARQKVDAFIEQARTQASDIIAEATIQAEKLRVDAVAKGDALAKKEALDRLEGLINTLDNEIKLLRTARTNFLSQNMAGIVDFSCALAGRILVTELRSRPDAIAERACALVNRMPPDVHVTLSVCPGDLEVIERYIHDSNAIVNRVTPSLNSDPAIQPGSMRLESDAGWIDAGLLETLEDLGKLLTDQARDLAGGPKNSGERSNGV